MATHNYLLRRNEGTKKNFWCLFAIVAIFISLLASCSGIEYAAPPTAPHPLLISITPALGWIVDDLHRCAVETPEIALIVNEAPASGLDFESAEAYLRLGSPPEAPPHFATLLGYESIVIIAHPGISPSQLEIIDVKIHYTSLDAEYQTWEYPPGNELRTIFDAVVLQGEAPSPQTKIAPNPTAMLEAIASNPGSVGYSSTHWLQPDVQSVAPGAAYADALRPPILALTTSEPQGATRQFLACLQNNLP